MAKWSSYYLIRIEFLGFRYHGWQKQAKLKSVQGMIDKTFEFILGHTDFKTLGSGRTDAKVSADDFAFELFVNEPFDCTKLLIRLNKELPSDIRAKSVQVVSEDFNIIQHSKIKEYHYYFSSGAKSHPFNAPLIRDFGAALNIELMKEAAALFMGTHNFKRFASKPTANTVFERCISQSVIEENTRFIDAYTPKETYVFKVRSKGFLRYQVRLMVGALVDVGRGLMTLADLKETLEDFNGTQIRHIAPSSGLILHKVEFDLELD
jgi:tRNA pseudouridine38-40 synthase